MKFELSKYMKLMATTLKTSMYITMLAIPIFIFYAIILTKDLIFIKDYTLIIPAILFFIIIILLFTLFPIHVIKLIKNLEENGFISFDEKRIKLFAITRMINIKWKYIEKIELVTAPNGKKCIGISFTTLENLAKSTANFLNLVHSTSGYHLSYSQDNFKENIEDICSKLNSANEDNISLQEENIYNYY